MVFNTARVEALELDNLVEVAKATIVIRSGTQGIARRACPRATTPRATMPSLDEVIRLFYTEGNRLDYKPVITEGAHRRDLPAEEAHLLITEATA